MGPIFIFLVPLFYLALAIVLIMGWKRSGREGKTYDRLVLLSRIGFVFGTSSASVAVMTAVSLRLTGSFQYHDSKLSWFYTIGALFALLGIVLSIVGAWRRSVLRWHALILSAGMLLLWCAWMSAE